MGEANLGGGGGGRRSHEEIRRLQEVGAGLYKG